jgi:hypothetical protein
MVGEDIGVYTAVMDMKCCSANALSALRRVKNRTACSLSDRTAERGQMEQPLLWKPKLEDGDHTVVGSAAVQGCCEAAKVGPSLAVDLSLNHQLG